MSSAEAMSAMIDNQMNGSVGYDAVIVCTSTPQQVGAAHQCSVAALRFHHSVVDAELPVATLSGRSYAHATCPHPKRCVLRPLCAAVGGPLARFRRTPRRLQRRR